MGNKVIHKTYALGVLDRKFSMEPSPTKLLRLISKPGWYQMSHARYLNPALGGSAFTIINAFSPSFSSYLPSPLLPMPYSSS
jgi:hypothetical protein